MEIINITGCQEDLVSILNVNNLIEFLNEHIIAMSAIMIHS